MKRIFAAVLVAGIFLAGCNLSETLLSPIVGSWEATVLGVTTNNIYHSDDTTTQTSTVGGVVGITKSGTWTSDSFYITRTWNDSSSDVQLYTFNSDKSQMTLTENGITIVYDRM